MAREQPAPGLEATACSSRSCIGIYELQSKLLKGVYIGDYTGDYYRGY